MVLPGIFNFFLYGALVVLQGVGRVSSQTNTAIPPGNIDEWTSWGGNVYNNRWNYKNSKINSTTIANLVPNCQFTYPLGVAATPVVLNYTVYYPSINGSYYALNMATCEFVWTINVAQIIYDFAVPSALVQKNSLPASRTSPQIDGDIIYFSTQSGALLVAADLNTGEVLGKIQVHDHPLAICTMSPTFYNGMIFQGVSSQEESATLDPSYECCDFIGKFAAFTFDRGSGQFTKKWEVNTLPADSGWAGAGAWGPNPSIDPVRNQVFFATGNTYIYPPEYTKCVNDTAACLPDDVWQESIIAVDIATGKVNWRKTISPLDGWVEICGDPGGLVSHSPLCPGAPGPDSDFAMAPTFVPASLGAGTTGVDSVIVGQKNGIIYNIVAETGEFQWVEAVGQDQAGSWLSWGMAIDDSKIHYTAINYGAKLFTIQPSGQTIGNSAWGAINIKDGTHVWSTPCPDEQLAYAPPGLVNDLIFVGQGGSNPNNTVNVTGAIIALSRTDGTILHKIPVDSVQDGGTVASDGFLVFSSGYAYRNPFEFGSFFVYGLPESIEEGKQYTQAQQAAAAASSASAASAAAASKTAAATASHKHNAASSNFNPSLAIYPSLLLLFLGL